MIGTDSPRSDQGCKTKTPPEQAGAYTLVPSGAKDRLHTPPWSRPRPSWVQEVPPSVLCQALGPSEAVVHRAEHPPSSRGNIALIPAYSTSGSVGSMARDSTSRWVATGVQCWPPSVDREIPSAVPTYSRR